MQKMSNVNLGPWRKYLVKYHMGTSQKTDKETEGQMDSWTQLMTITPPGLLAKQLMTNMLYARVIYQLYYITKGTKWFFRDVIIHDLRYFKVFSLRFTSASNHESSWIYCLIMTLMLPLIVVILKLPSDTIWRQRSGSTLARVMACCLMAPSHYLNQCWLIISKALWHSSEGIIMRRFEDTNQ